MTESETTTALIITQFFPPESMGGAHRWEKLAAHMDDSVDPHILCTHPTFPFGEFERQWQPLCRESVNGVPVTRLFTYQPTTDNTLGRILNYGIFAVLSSIYVLLTFWRYDCIVTMSAPHTTFLPGLVGKLTGRDWVVDIFDLWIDNASDLGYVDEESLPYQAMSQLERLSLAKADAIFVITDTMAEYYEDKYPDLAFDVHVIPFGVDTEMFSPDVEPKGSTDVIYTGNLGTGQAFIPFLKGFAQLGGEPELTIIGDGERRAELEALVEELDVSGQVSFEGYVSREEIPRLLVGAKVSLVPLKTEYQLDYARPTKLLETMAVGTPYVASNVDEISKLTQEYNTGADVKNEANSISNTLQKMLDKTRYRDRCGKNSINFVDINHHWGSIGKQTSLVISEVHSDDGL
ncbi:glycosyltransferase family 4 protein [Haloarcula amylovorans]|uniref:glycosyltransferase family 4 protein n=1 Tax=Haloarcula amylovorans TaxID=2562280 RepID=UPI001FD82D0A|nr:glycosyltransferase family 4 protein [Halomicroarcula amylolytica]